MNLTALRVVRSCARACIYDGEPVPASACTVQEEHHTDLCQSWLLLQGHPLTVFDVDARLLPLVQLSGCRHALDLALTSLHWLRSPSLRVCPNSGSESAAIAYRYEAPCAEGHVC
jgi:hypothetical protein